MMIIAGCVVSFIYDTSGLLLSHGCCALRGFRASAPYTLSVRCYFPFRSCFGEFEVVPLLGGSLSLRRFKVFLAVTLVRPSHKSRDWAIQTESKNDLTFFTVLQRSSPAKTMHQTVSRTDVFASVQSNNLALVVSGSESARIYSAAFPLVLPQSPPNPTRFGNNSIVS
jgi:hypothetical protein